MPFDKGHKKLGGRKPHTPNKVAQSVRALLNTALPEDELLRLWKKYLYHRETDVAFAAFKLAVLYMFGRPAASPINEEDAPLREPPQWDLSGIPSGNVPITEE
jgi:hypothetical protein